MIPRSATVRAGIGFALILASALAFFVFVELIVITLHG